MHNPISRRAALKASGITIALPLLESMKPAIGHEYTVPPKRMVLICNALGLHSPSLFPKTPGSDYANTEYLDLLQPHRSDFTIFSGLSHPDQNGKDPHDTKMTFLTAAINPGLGGFKNSISVDQVAAMHLGHATRFPSITLGSNTQESQSYDSNGVMLPADYRPSRLFTKLFMAGSPEEQRRQRQRLANGRSILDAVGDQTKALNRQASGGDRKQLDEYSAAIRTAEKELAASDAWLDRPKPEVNVEVPQDIAEPSELLGRIRELMNLIPLMLQTDSTRVVSLMIQDHQTVPNIAGVQAGHHPLSHHGQDPAKIAQLKIIESGILSTFSGFLTQLGQRSAQGTRLLDHTAVLFGSNLGNANAHDPSNLPVILAGGGYRHGQYVAYDKKNNIPLCNLFVNMLNNMGVETESFATSTGSLEI
ncbi:MAG: DUF1552 domain-containing protein [Planctomycetaceae bacterium]|jgi:hypothetical protein|nr:DUF1552 domain-containing protein [Planctomycetaceae bacterium]MBT4724951.1 DUF1552 domain-containing protein [Planctomycetaceae bacterium]MBT5125644.1 DUF1552 domain-containing protein [Planctomycetaceae bacterium]MBT5599395.1 DUF1552 domain-containing protein [Planctomycetaceae bacterium]MBT5882818.1 DUF1552 domain-containing protein [Planctomycetaceae bacterium]